MKKGGWYQRTVEGQITVFLSLIFLCIFSLMCGLIESARTAGARWYLKVAADSAMDSLFSCYHRTVWDQYRLFLLEFTESDDIGNKWLEYMRPYEETHGWYPMKVESASVDRLVAITDKNGQYLQQEIIDYMKFGIWKNMDLDEMGSETLWKNLKEAKTMGNISETYSGHAKAAVKLEESLEAIEKSLEKQRKLKTEASEEIADQSGKGFRQTAQKLKKEIENLPRLIKRYDKRADELAERLKETQKSLEKQKEDLSETARVSLEGELNGYKAYTDQEGERRIEIDGLYESEKGELEVIERAKERSEEVENIISDWDEEEDGELNEGALWDSVSDIWNEIAIPAISVTVGIKSPEKQNLLEEIGKLVDLDILSLVLPDGAEVSKGVLSMEDFPSAAHNAEVDEKLKAGFLDRILTDEYCGRFLTCFRSEEEKPVRYEQEYILGGQPTDEENLKKTVVKLVTVREGLNLIHILSDQQKREEAKALASVITGLLGAAPLTGILTFFIMSVWALGESVADVKALLAGQKVVMFKTKETWNLSLDQLLAFGEAGKLEGTAGDEEGLDYEGYLKLLFFTIPEETLLYRLMDVIQMNVKREESGFLMSHCAYHIGVRGTGNGKHLFFGGEDGRYPMTVTTEKAY